MTGSWERCPSSVSSPSWFTAERAVMGLDPGGHWACAFGKQISHCHSSSLSSSYRPEVSSLHQRVLLPRCSTISQSCNSEINHQGLTPWAKEDTSSCKLSFPGILSQYQEGWATQVSACAIHCSRHCELSEQRKRFLPNLSFYHSEKYCTIYLNEHHKYHDRRFRKPK